MARIKYSADTIQYISTFESLTNAKIKDCIVTDSILFIVHENEIGKAIGKGGSNIRRAEGIFNKRIRLVEFSSDVRQFVRNLIYPAQAKDIAEENGVVLIHCPDSKTKGIVIGRDRHSINFVNKTVKRYFDVNEVKVA